MNVLRKAGKRLGSRRFQHVSWSSSNRSPEHPALDRLTRLPPAADPGWGHSSRAWMSDVGSHWGQTWPGARGRDALAACCFSAFDLASDCLRVELAGGLEPPTACYKEPEGQATSVRDIYRARAA